MSDPATAGGWRSFWPSSLPTPLVEVVAAFATGSLSFLSDAGHMGTDALGIAMSLAAILTATRMERRERQTFGLFRLEILAALANALLLVGIAGYAIYE